MKKMKSQEKLYLYSYSKSYDMISIVYFINIFNAIEVFFLNASMHLNVFLLLFTH